MYEHYSYLERKENQSSGGRDPVGDSESHPLPRFRSCGRLHGPGGPDGRSVWRGHEIRSQESPLGGS